MNNFDLAIRVYYEDTDAGGVVYHSNYLNFMERARTEWLRHFGYEQDDLLQQLQIVFVVRNINIDYLKPARFNDLLNVHNQVKHLTRTSIQFKQSITRTQPSQSSDASVIEHLAEATVTVVCVHTTHFRPTAIPHAIRGLFERAN